MLGQLVVIDGPRIKGQILARPSYTADGKRQIIFGGVDYTDPAGLLTINSIEYGVWVVAIETGREWAITEVYGVRSMGVVNGKATWDKRGIPENPTRRIRSHMHKEAARISETLDFAASIKPAFTVQALPELITNIEAGLASAKHSLAAREMIQAAEAPTIKPLGAPVERQWVDYRGAVTTVVIRSAVVLSADNPDPIGYVGSGKHAHPEASPSFYPAASFIVNETTPDQPALVVTPATQTTLLPQPAEPSPQLAELVTNRTAAPTIFELVDKAATDYENAIPTRSRAALEGVIAQWLHNRGHDPLKVIQVAQALTTSSVEVNGRTVNLPPEKWVTPTTDFIGWVPIIASTNCPDVRHPRQSPIHKFVDLYPRLTAFINAACLTQRRSNAEIDQIADALKAVRS